MPPDDQLCKTEFWKLGIQTLGYAVTWLIVLVGWNVSSNQNNRRDARKEVRECIDSAIALIREAENNGARFLGTVSFDVNIYWATFFSVQRILATVEALDLPNQAEIMTQQVAFRRVMTNKITIGPTSPYPSENEKLPLLMELSRSSNRFISTLERGYRQRYPLS